MTDTWTRTSDSPYVINPENPHPHPDGSRSEGGRMPTPAMPQPDEAKPEG
jgi:hypothetical protein